MGTIRLIHWRSREAQERVDLLQSAGYDVAYDVFDSALMLAMRECPPDAVVIDLGRLPSQGRDVAMTIRQYKATRHVPLVFAGGDSEKVVRIRALLPDARYAPWEEMLAAVRHAIAQPPKDPIVPSSIMESYRGTPLAQKLGIKAGAVVVLHRAPEGFEATLGHLPEGTTVLRDAVEERDVSLWFVTSRYELEDGIDQMGSFGRNGGLWILWPKKASGMSGDISQISVREVGVAAGLVDFKVCSVDATWSGLRFTTQREETG